MTLSILVAILSSAGLFLFFRRRGNNPANIKLKSLAGFFNEQYKDGIYEFSYESMPVKVFIHEIHNDSNNGGLELPEYLAIQLYPNVKLTKLIPPGIYKQNTIFKLPIETHQFLSKIFSQGLDEVVVGPYQIGPDYIEIRKYNAFWSKDFKENLKLVIDKVLPSVKSICEQCQVVKY